MGYDSVLFDRKILGKYNALSSIYADQLPNDIKEIFKWSEFINANVPLVSSALEKMAIVSITNIQYKTTDMSELTEGDSNSWKTIMEDELDIKTVAQDIGFNKLLYGNVFLSVNTPIFRQMECSLCKEKSSEEAFGNIMVKPSLQEKDKPTEKLVFKGTCPKCKKASSFTAVDTVIKKADKINIIQWPVSGMLMNKDLISGKGTFYYKMESSYEKSIKTGSKDQIFNLPLNTIIAALKGTSIKFDDNRVLHLPRRSLQGSKSSWGMPILTSAIPDMMSLLLARKANEKIFSDMIFPLRSLTPDSKGTDGSSIYNYMGSTDIASKIEGILKSHKNDPTSVKYFPIPLRAATVFGEGKSLNLAREIREMGEDVVGSIGVPIEFVRGGLSYTGGGASIRILENQLRDLTMSIEKAMNFIAKHVSVILDKSPIKMKLIPFKLVDDIQDKQVALSMHEKGKISDHTMADMLNIDAQTENARMEAEAKIGARTQMFLQKYQQELAQNLASKAETEAMLNQSSTQQVNQQAIMQEADGVAQMLSQLQQGQRKSELDRLQKENWLLYVAVKERLEFNERKQNTADAQEGQAAQMAGSPGEGQ